MLLERYRSNDRAELTARLLNDGFAAQPPSGDFETLETFADPASEPGPIDMRICSGTGVDRVGFTESVLGPIVAVRDPIKVITDTPPTPPAPPKPAVKPTVASTGKGNTTTATASAAKGGSATAPTANVSARLPTNAAPLAIVVPPPRERYRIHDDEPDDKDS